MDEFSTPKIESWEDFDAALRRIDERSKEVRELLKEARFHRERMRALAGLPPRPRRSPEDNDRAAA